MTDFLLQHKLDLIRITPLCHCHERCNDNNVISRSRQYRLMSCHSANSDV